ncbi:Hypothetical predicted protein [Pelobates cultripes]|nr:Hypothetical predicted protein [Pelobates cultripes]
MSANECKIEHGTKTAEEFPGIYSNTCDSSSSTFETDERLNTVSFEVFGLRCLVIKGIIFNIISTQRIWSG